MLEHGGRVRQAARRFGFDPAEMLDLSTGINPEGWPVPKVPAAVWGRLPEDDDSLVDVARAYYSAPHLLPVPGSQAAIQWLPRLRPHSRVGVLSPSYSEHAHAWKQAGHAVAELAAIEISACVHELDVLVVVNPNNPTGVRFERNALLDWHRQLARHRGWLIVDEAFMDPTPHHSLVPYCEREGLIVLRSLGKFFGLAGTRVGFVGAQPGLQARLRERLGPWCVANPSRWVARAALRDRVWQHRARQCLRAGSERLERTLSACGLPPSGGCDLFQWVHTPKSASIREHLAQAGVLVRAFRTPSSLRVGLPGSEAQWHRLQTALATLNLPSASAS